MMTPKPFALLLAILCLCIGLFFIYETPNAGEFHVDATPSGTAGISLGPSIHNGRTHVVDGISGATQTETIDNWSTYAFNAAVVFDMGVPTSSLGLNGTVGFRILSDFNIPKKMFAQGLLARYRFKFNLLGTSLHSIEPWAGIGISFHFIPLVSKDVFLQLPLAAGCDFGLNDHWLVSTDIQLNSMNPIGPTQRRETTAASDHHKLRYDSYILRIGLAFRFY